MPSRRKGVRDTLSLRNAALNPVLVRWGKGSAPTVAAAPTHPPTPQPTHERPQTGHNWMRKSGENTKKRSTPEPDTPAKGSTKGPLYGAYRPSRDGSGGADGQQPESMVVINPSVVQQAEIGHVVIAKHTAGQSGQTAAVAHGQDAQQVAMPTQLAAPSQQQQSSNSPSTQAVVSDDANSKTNRASKITAAKAAPPGSPHNQRRTSARIAAATSACKRVGLQTDNGTVVKPSPFGSLHDKPFDATCPSGPGPACGSDTARAATPKVDTGALCSDKCELASKPELAALSNPSPPSSQGGASREGQAMAVGPMEPEANTAGVTLLKEGTMAMPPGPPPGAPSTACKSDKAAVACNVLTLECKGSVTRPHVKQQSPVESGHVADLSATAVQRQLQKAASFQEVVQALLSANTRPSAAEPTAKLAAQPAVARQPSGPQQDVAGGVPTSLQQAPSLLQQSAAAAALAAAAAAAHAPLAPQPSLGGRNSLWRTVTQEWLQGVRLESLANMFSLQSQLTPPSETAPGDDWCLALSKVTSSVPLAADVSNNTLQRVASESGQPHAPLGPDAPVKDPGKSGPTAEHIAENRQGRSSAEGAVLHRLQTATPKPDAPLSALNIKRSASKSRESASPVAKRHVKSNTQPPALAEGLPEASTCTSPVRERKSKSPPLILQFTHPKPQSVRKQQALQPPPWAFMPPSLVSPVQPFAPLGLSGQFPTRTGLPGMIPIGLGQGPYGAPGPHLFSLQMLQNSLLQGVGLPMMQQLGAVSTQEQNAAVFLANLSAAGAAAPQGAAGNVTMPIPMPAPQVKPEVTPTQSATWYTGANTDIGTSQVNRGAPAHTMDPGMPPLPSLAPASSCLQALLQRTATWDLTKLSTREQGIEELTEQLSALVESGQHALQGDAISALGALQACNLSNTNFEQLFRDPVRYISALPQETQRALLRLPGGPLLVAREDSALHVSKRAGRTAASTRR